MTIHNASNQDYVLTACPDYTEALILNGTVRNYQLDCAPVGVIKAGQSVKFEMKLLVPAQTPTGPSTFLWGLIDGRVSRSSIMKPIVIG